VSSSAGGVTSGVFRATVDNAVYLREVCAVSAHASVSRRPITYLFNRAMIACKGVSEVGVLKCCSMLLIGVWVNPTGEVPAAAKSEYATWRTICAGVPMLRGRE
jgi:hypothetical protein